MFTPIIVTGVLSISTYYMYITMLKDSVSYITMLKDSVWGSDTELCAEEGFDPTG